MATSKLFRVCIFFVFFVLNSGSAAGRCPEDAHASFSVWDWVEEIPKSGRLVKFKKGSGFSVIEEELKDGFVAGRFSGSDKTSLSVEFSGVWMSFKSDYALILDEKLEFRISDIKSTNSKRTGCPYESIQINACLMKGGRGFSFPMRCAEPVTQR